MRHGLFGGISLLAVAAALAAPPAALAQPGPLGDAFGSAGPSDLGIPGEPSEKIPIPTGNPGGHGFFSFFEMVYLAQNNTLGDQVIAKRGLVDSTGAVAGAPGLLLGSGVDALRTQDLGRTGFSPGFNIGVGYKTDDNVSVYASYLTTMRHRQSVGATSATPFSRGRADLTDTYLYAPVFSFPAEYKGPVASTRFERGLPIPPTTVIERRIFINNLGNPIAVDVPVTVPGRPGEDNNVFYGIWNGASDMVISFERQFSQAEVGARVPLFATEYSRIYGLAGGRFDWFFERFWWRTVKYNIDNIADPQDAANYTNTLSQRMYGPYVGCGHEVYMGNRFSGSLDLTAAGLINIIKERAKYERGDDLIQNKRSRNDYSLVPSITAHANLWWYPIEGVQVRAGYSAWTFFNTRSMDQPVGFNYTSIDPVYEFQAFRIVHGLNFGLGLFF